MVSIDNHLQIFVEMLLITLQYWLIFLLKQYVCCYFFINMEPLFEVSLPFNICVLLISKDLKHQETIF